MALNMTLTLFLYSLILENLEVDKCNADVHVILDCCISTLLIIDRCARSCYLQSKQEEREFLKGIYKHTIYFWTDLAEFGIQRTT